MAHPWHFIFLTVIVVALIGVMWLWYRLYRKIKLWFEMRMMVSVDDKNIPPQTFLEWLRTPAAFPLVAMVLLQIIVLSVMSYNVANHYDLGHMFGF